MINDLENKLNEAIKKLNEAEECLNQVPEIPGGEHIVQGEEFLKARDAIDQANENLAILFTKLAEALQVKEEGEAGGEGGEGF